MKKTGKVLLILAIVTALLVGTAVTAFADEPSEADRPQDRPHDKPQDDRAMTKLFEKYDPDDLEAYQQLMEENKAFHEEREGIVEEMRQQVRMQITALLESLLDGDMTIEEAREAYVDMREKNEAFKEGVGEVLDTKKAEKEQIREQLEDIRAQMREALDEDDVDEDVMESLLQQTLALLRQRLELDQSTAAQIDEISEECFSV